MRTISECLAVINRLATPISEGSLNRSRDVNIKPNGKFLWIAMHPTERDFARNMPDLGEYDEFDGIQVYISARKKVKFTDKGSESSFKDLTPDAQRFFQSIIDQCRDNVLAIRSASSKGWGWELEDFRNWIRENT